MSYNYDNEGYIIKSIKFGVLPPHEIIKMAKVTVIRDAIYEPDGSPVTGGLRDPHFGAIEPGERCPVCGNTRDTCPGHFGKIDLARPVIVPHYGEALYAVLQATCRNCGRILIPSERIRYLLGLRDRLRRKWPKLTEIFSEEIRKEAASRMECPHCGAPQFKIRFMKPFTFYEDHPEGERRLNPIDVRERVEKTIDDDLRLLGFDPEYARPEWMIITALPVPPLSVRPSITLETGYRSEDDLTHALAEIVRQNERLKNFLLSNAPETMIEDAWLTLQHVVAAYIDNELPNIYQLTHRRKRALKTLAQRLKGKEGRLRGNLSGKRVNYSARTVISPDPFISINEVGVPIEIAKILTVPMKVTPYNIDEARKYVLNGPNNWPGATYVYKARNGKKIDLRYIKNYKQLAEGLEVGDVVERHLIDGDIVLFNRQPSLHRMSILGHIVKVMPYKTFRLNPLVCPPYNADFDGDEMNLHVPRLYEAMAEARELLLVEKHILTPRYGGPIIGGRQDYISGGYLLTVKTSLYTEEEVEQILAAANYKGPLPEPAITKPRRLWTGKQIVSLFLPEDLDFKGKAKINAGQLKCSDEECFHDSYIVVSNGKLLEGVLDKNAIGAEQPGNLLHIIALEYGTGRAREFLDTLFRAFIRVLEMRGLTMALDDIEIPEEAKREIAEMINEYKNKVAELIKEYEEGRLEVIPGRTPAESLELKIINLLQELREKVGQIAVSHMDPFNDMFIMARTGARGGEVNITQMAAMLGQQTVRGKRIRRGFRTRTLPHFKENDLSPEARGFIKGNFRDGLRPTEVFFHAAGGREGLVDTAVKTSQSGYMQRRLINALQDLVVSYDGTVKDAWGNIVQFKYGEDGVDPMLTYHGDSIDVDRIIEKVGKNSGKGR
ncbi:MAG: DNA-directed RNA polymerase subunit A' [Desulfurococcales archaeon]|nr:DNA-directed RNA polymerase subunit A' [Desulfurococcales archaeon]